jgi:hypothetical protein
LDLNSKTVFERYKAMQAIGTRVSVPYHVWHLFGTPQKELSIFGDDVCLGEDYGSLAEAREAIEWYANQLGGKIKWEKI